MKRSGCTAIASPCSRPAPPATSRKWSGSCFASRPARTPSTRRRRTSTCASWETPRVGAATSADGRGYRLGYGLTVAQCGALRELDRPESVQSRICGTDKITAPAVCAAVIRGRRQRTVKRRTIILRRIDAKYVHQETVWQTPWQPFIPWVHEETDYLGERDMRGTVRDAKDAQRVYNVNVSSLSEAVNDAPKNRVVVYKGQFGKPDSMTRKGWENAPNKRFAFLEVEPITIDGKPATFPQPFNVEPAIMGLAHAIAQADNDLKATGRFHDASLAEPGPEQSGKAIIARQRQDELSNGGFINGHLIGLASTCRHLIFLYRVLYTEAQIVRITGDDDQKRKVMIYNGEEGDPRQQEGFEQDKKLKDDDFFDIGAGQYDVEVKPAPQAERAGQQAPPGGPAGRRRTGEAGSRPAPGEAPAGR